MKEKHSWGNELIAGMKLSQLAEELDGELKGEDLMFSSISTDTRSLIKEDLYLALVGENFDGNSFVEEAEKKGACAAITSRDVDAGIPTLRVADTHLALREIARLTRLRSTAKVVALTGSQGKTTVKEMLGAILGNSADCLATEANFNNTIGVPLTLLRVEERHKYIVIEMGADCAGEIAFSVSATQPDVALITNASPAHIEGFGSLDGIVRAKGEIIEGLKKDGVLVLNGDDAHVDDWIARAGDKKKVLFSYNNTSGAAEYYAADVEFQKDGTSHFNLITPAGKQVIRINFLGKHNVLNAVAAAAVAIETGVSLEDVAQGLAGLNPVKGRLSKFVGINGCVIIDDSYNASPGSFSAAIDVLASVPGRTILVAGDMKELGAETDSAHAFVGEYAAKAGVTELWAVGEKSKLMVAAFKAKGRHFSSKDELLQALISIAGSEMTVLIKGSRAARMDDIVMALKSDGEN